MGVKKFWSSLKDDQGGLLHDVPQSALSKKMVICWTPPGSAGTTPTRGKRYYTYFDSYLDYSGWITGVSPERRSCYEVIWGENPQRPYLDIDIAKSEMPDVQPFFDSLIDAIVGTCASLGVMLSFTRDLVICQSHGPEKWSYHIILPNFRMVHHKMNEQFCLQVISRLPEEFKKWVDSCVYKSNQLFRLVGTEKTGSGRKKMLCRTWRWHNTEYTYEMEEPENEVHRMNLELESTLIQFTERCRDFPLFEGVIIDVARPVQQESEEISLKIAEEMLDMVAEKAGISRSSYKFPYVIQGIKGSMVLLKRLKGSRCPICQRLHEHENPFLFISKGSVYFHCRRATSDQKYEVGPIKPEWVRIVPPMDEEVLKDFLHSTTVQKKPSFVLPTFIPPKLKQKYDSILHE